MSTLQERMEELLRDTGWSTSQVASTAGVSSSAVSQWLGKGTKEIHSIGNMEAAIALERATGFSALWLAKGKGSKKVLPQQRVEPIDLQAAIAIVGKAINATPHGENRQGATAMLSQYIGNPEANADLIPLIARRLSGEMGEEKGNHSQRAA